MVRLYRPLALIALLVAGGCFREKRDDDEGKRLAQIEQRLDAQDNALAESRAQPASAELAILAQQIATLTEQVRALEEKLARTPTAPPPVRRRVPDPVATYAVPVGSSPVLGSPKAKVTLVMAFEFACQYCHRAWSTIDDLRTKYGKDLRVVYKQYVVHPTTARPPAHAACAAHRQGKWRPTAELLWAKAYEPHQFDQANIDAIATEAGLDMLAYQTDITGACVQLVKEEHALLNKVGVSGTPAFFINGRFMSGARPITEFQALIDAELAEATALIKKGTKLERLYDDEIVAKGITEIPLP